MSGTGNLSGFFSYFHRQNKLKIKVSVLCSVRTKALTNHKKEKNINFGFNPNWFEGGRFPPPVVFWIRFFGSDFVR